eukprot:m.49901 g.49901  ORF g.49901 m.49901 type:complete len:108 (+) comp10875_c0_seq2:81-404(+)
MSDIVTLFVSASTSSVKAERRFQKSDSVEHIKSKLELVVGIPAGSQRLHLKDTNGKDVCILEGVDTLLGAFPVEDFFGLFVSFIFALISFSIATAAYSKMFQVGWGA